MNDIAKYKKTIQQVADKCLELPQVNCPVRHLFAPGIYIREIFMPANTFVIGCEHKTEHFNIILKGRAKVMIDGVTKMITAPDCFVSKPGIRKTLLIEEDMVWQTVHPTELTDINELERMLVVDKPEWHKELEVLCP